MQDLTRRPIKPSPGQVRALERLIKASDYIFTEAIEEYKDAQKNDERFLPSELYQCLIAEAYGDPEREWLTKVSIDPLLRAVDDAHSDWSAYQSRLRDGREATCPKRPKSGQDSVRFSQSAFAFVGDRLHPKSLLLDSVGNLALNWETPISTNPEFVIIARRGKEWFVMVPRK